MKRRGRLRFSGPPPPPPPPSSLGFAGDMKRRGRLRFSGPKEIRDVYRALDLLRRLGHKADFIDHLRNDLMEQIRRHDERAKFHNSVADLKEIQSKFDKLEASFNKEIAANPTEILSVGLKGKMYEETTPVEASYNKLCEQLYTKRFKIVNGAVPVKLRVIHEAMRSSFEDILKNEAMRSTFEDTIENKGVPNFWLTVMKAKPVLCKEINGRDEEVLKYLKDIKLCKVDNPKGYKFEFEFAENPFFKNQFLTRTYHMIDEDNMMPVDIIGTDIEWFGDKCSSEPVLVPSERESCNRVAAGYESFFDFFSFPVNYEDAEDRQIWMQHDYEIRWALQDIIHGAISYFLEKTPDFPIAEDKLPYETYQNGGLEDGAADDESLYEFDCQLSDNGKVEIKKAEQKKASPAALVPRLGDYDSYVRSGYVVPSTGGETSHSYPDRLAPYAGEYGGLGGFPRDEGFGPYGGSGYGYGSDSGTAAGYGSGGLYGRGGGAGAGSGRYHPYAR